MNRCIFIIGWVVDSCLWINQVNIVVLLSVISVVSYSVSWFFSVDFVLNISIRIVVIKMSVCSRLSGCLWCVGWCGIIFVLIVIIISMIGILIRNIDF